MGIGISGFYLFHSLTHSLALVHLLLYIYIYFPDGTTHTRKYAQTRIKIKIQHRNSITIMDFVLFCCCCLLLHKKNNTVTKYIYNIEKLHNNNNQSKNIYFMIENMKKKRRKFALK